MYLLCREILQSSTERLFRDIEILYDGEYYCITDFDENAKQFIAVREDDLSSIEQICATRLFDKIIAGNHDGRVPGKSLIVGALRDGNEKDLKSMIELWQTERCEPKKKIYDWITMKQDILNILVSSDRLLDFLRNYDRIFFLDCPGIYSEVCLDGMNDVSLVKNSHSDNLSDIMGIDKPYNIRYFNNRNQFCTIYYRVQNYLVDKVVVDGRKTRSLSVSVFDYFENLFERDEAGRTMYPGLWDKEIYLYYSRPDAFPQKTYDMYDFCRFELHSAKMCRVVKFSNEDTKLKNSADKTMKLTFFKILESVSCSGTFYCNMTGDDVRDSEPDSDRIMNAIYIAQNTLIDMEYGQNTEYTQKTNVFDISVTVTYPRKDKDGMEIPESRGKRYELMIKQTVYEGFRRLRDNKGVENLVLFDTYHNAFVNVLSCCAASYNDMLFYHLCKKLHEIGNVAFVIKRFEFWQKDYDANSEEYEKECPSYSDKRLVVEVMETLDSFIYLDSDRYRLNQRAMSNRNMLHTYISDVMRSCEDVGYTDSILYSRLLTFYR
ncbi:MAG: hypothetical protein LUD72_04445 [Bacteroidales bacterium]|nr:hypothetical protein [Bacteroidales bacterium]